MSRHPFAGASPRASRLRLPLAAAFVAIALLGAAAAQAQPFDAWLRFTGDPTNGWVRAAPRRSPHPRGHTNGWARAPDSSSLDISGNFTFEAWVSISNSVTGEDCRSIAGKNYLETWWIGQCNVAGQATLRSYLKGAGSLRQGGTIPRNVLTHIAVVFNGVQRLHYINGELAASFAESGPLPTNGTELRIGSDGS